MSENELLSVLNTSEPIKENKPIKDVRKKNYDADKILEHIKPPLNQKIKLLNS